MDKGNPSNPTGEAGVKMLHRMNNSHYEMTGWGLDFLDIDKKDRILDIGCGGGMTLHRLADKVPAGHLTGIDYSEVSVEESRQLNETLIDAGLIDVQNASVDDIPFADETFDKIVSVESFYFWPDPPENLKEAVRVLKDSGHLMLIAEIYNSPDLSEEERKNVEEMHLFNPTIDEFRKYFEAAGLSDVKIHTRDDHPWICVEGTK